MPKHSRNAKKRAKPLRLPAERTDAFDRGSRPTAIAWLVAVFGLYLCYFAFIRDFDGAAQQVSSENLPASEVTAAGPTGCLSLLLSGPLGDGVDARPRRIYCDAP